MKISKSIVLTVTVASIALSALVSSANAAPKSKTATLQGGTIKYTAGFYLEGQSIPLGFDDYGYNYQAHMFSGSYFNAYANSANLPPYTGDDAAYLAAKPTATNHWAWEYRNIKLVMKWNDAWISNVDRDGDGKLDRHYGFSSYIGSGAWENNIMSWTEVDANGVEHQYNDFVKIVAVPSDASLQGEMWIDASGKEIGSSIWGEFALIQEISNGKVYVSPAGPGYGKY